MSFELSGEIKVKYNGQIIMTEKIYDLLEAIDECHSLKFAAEQTGMQYSNASVLLKNAQKAGWPLTEVKVDQKGRKRTYVTKKAYGAMKVWMEANDYLFEPEEDEEDY